MERAAMATDRQETTDEQLGGVSPDRNQVDTHARWARGEDLLRRAYGRSRRTRAHTVLVAGDAFLRQQRQEC